MFKVYILYSESKNGYYIGHSENLENRLMRHNKGLVNSTKSGVLWMVVYEEDVLTKQDAYKRELQVKSYKGGEAFKKLIEKK